MQKNPSNPIDLQNPRSDGQIGTEDVVVATSTLEVFKNFNLMNQFLNARVLKLLKIFFRAMREVRISENFQFLFSGFLLFSG